MTQLKKITSFDRGKLVQKRTSIFKTNGNMTYVLMMKFLCVDQMVHVYKNFKSCYLFFFFWIVCICHVEREMTI
jgi:hypothetical protein